MSALFGFRDNDDDRDDDDDRYNDRRRNNNGYYGNNTNNSYGEARHEGFRDSLRAGAEDARRGVRYNPHKNSGRRRNDTDDYNRNGDGNRGQYKKAYREAFLQGYNQGYSRRNSVFGSGNRRRGN